MTKPPAPQKDTLLDWLKAIAIWAFLSFWLWFMVGSFTNGMCRDLDRRLLNGCAFANAVTGCWAGPSLTSKKQGCYRHVPSPSQNLAERPRRRSFSGTQFIFVARATLG